MSSGEHGSEELLQFLRSAKSERESGLHDPKKIRDEWLADLQSLIGELKKFLEPAVSQGLLEIQQADVTIHEEPLGEYRAPSLRILAPNDREVTVLPRGRFVIGGEGRVDLGSGPKTAMMIRHGPRTWKFQWRAGGPRGWESAPVDAETFSSAVLNLLT